MNNNYKKLANLVASKLSKKELIQLAFALDKDSGSDFCYWIQHETQKIVPELYNYSKYSSEEEKK